MNLHKIDPSAFQSAAGSGYFVGEAAVQPLISADDGVDVIAVRFEAGRGRTCTRTAWLRSCT